MDIEIKKLAHNDIDSFIEVIRLFEDVFEMKNFEIPPREHLQMVLQKPDFIVIAATEGKIVVGGLTAYVLEQYYSSKKLGYIFDLAVRNDKQRRGFGRSLVEKMITHSKENGFDEVFVQADKVDVHALKFYRALGGVEEDVSHFTFGGSHS